MPRSRSRGRPEGDLPPLMRRVVDAARKAADVNRGESWKGHAEALEALGGLALISVPARGALAPHEDELFSAVSDVALKHLALKKARRAWSDAFEAIADDGQRDAVEAAHMWVVSVSDTTYFYAGLAFGLTLAELANRR